MSKLHKSDIKFMRNGWIKITWWQNGERFSHWFDDIDIAWAHVKRLGKDKVTEIFVN